MKNSMIIEKRRVANRRCMLVQIMVEPKEIKLSNDEKYKTDKYITPENWNLIDKVIDSLMEIYVNSKKRDEWEMDVQKEVEIAAINYKIQYVFQNETRRDLFNNAFFQVQSKELYKPLLSLIISDDSSNLRNRITELEKEVEQLKKEKEEPYSPSQETKPTDIIEYKASPPTAIKKEDLPFVDPEYVPLPLNGSSENHTYRPTKINGTDGTDPVENEPYEPPQSEMREDVPLPKYIPTTSNKETGTKKDSTKSCVSKRKRKKDDESPKRTLDDWISQTPKPTKNKTESKSKEEKKKTDLNKSDELFGSSSGSDDNTVVEPISKRSSEEKEDMELKKTTVKKRRFDIKKEEAEASLTVSKKTSKDKKEKDNRPGTLPMVLVPREEALKKIEELKATSDMIDEITAASGLSSENIPRKKVDYITLHDMDVGDVLDTFDDFKDYLTGLFEKYKDLPERYLKTKSELTYYTEVFNVFTEDQVMAMVKYLEKMFGIDACSGQHAEFFFGHLVSEWTLKIYMYHFGFECKQDALDRIKQQEIDHPFQMEVPVLPWLAKKEKTTRKRR